MNRLWRTLSYMWYPSQYCGVSGNTILDTVKTVRDAIAYTGLTRPIMDTFLPLHSSFWQDLAYLTFSHAKNYGYSMKFTTLIQAIYDKAFSSVQIKGYFPRPSPIQCSVTQGFSVSMLIFASVLNLLICLFERHLTAIRIGHRIKKTAVVS